jgi:hypothetical protein
VACSFLQFEDVVSFEPAPRRKLDTAVKSALALAEERQAKTMIDAGDLDRAV